MTTAERQLGLLGLIRQQKVENSYDDNLRSDKGWGIYGDRVQGSWSQWYPLDGYQRNFNEVLDHASLVEFVSRRQSPVVVDLMGPSDMLADLFTRYELKDIKPLGVAVSFADIRSEGKKVRDKELNINQIKGDVMDSETWRKIEKRLAGRKADLIMERAVGGLLNIPREITFYTAMLVKIWKLLRSDGGMFVGEIRQSEELLQGINSLRGNGIDLLIKSGSVRVVKTPSSPEDIGPVLRSMEIPEAPKDALDFMVVGPNISRFLSR